ncbi:hypothetical protein MP228_008303 [Amoeboaphelidium protococcarum]|nr:hypothetical protein MP228_008303 [Amoeboaphelidium protococcarum]
MRDKMPQAPETILLLHAIAQYTQNICDQQQIDRKITNSAVGGLQKLIDQLELGTDQSVTDEHSIEFIQYCQKLGNSMSISAPVLPLLEQNRLCIPDEKVMEQLKTNINEGCYRQYSKRVMKQPTTTSVNGADESQETKAVHPEVSEYLNAAKAAAIQRNEMALENNQQHPSGSSRVATRSARTAAIKEEYFESSCVVDYPNLEEFTALDEDSEVAGDASSNALVQGVRQRIEELEEFIAGSHRDALLGAKRQKIKRERDELYALLQRVKSIEDLVSRIEKDDPQLAKKYFAVYIGH